MGIEPTRDIVVPLNGFEDRGRHQVASRLQVRIILFAGDDIIKALITFNITAA